MIRLNCRIFSKKKKKRSDQSSKSLMNQAIEQKRRKMTKFSNAKKDDQIQNEIFAAQMKLQSLEKRNASVLLKKNHSFSQVSLENIKLLIQH